MMEMPLAKPTKGNVNYTIMIFLLLCVCSYVFSIVAPIEFIPRMGKLGLGAAPKPQAMPVKKRPRKPGETDKKVCVCVCVCYECIWYYPQ